MPKFLLKFNAAVIKEIPIAKDTLTVGRKDDNDIVIDNPAVSGHHAKITLTGDTFFVEDLESTNGVFVNEKKVMKAGLKNNDVIGIVKHALVFIDDRAAAAAAPDPKPAPTAEATMMIAPEKQQEMASAGSAAAQRKPAMLRVIKGVVDKPEYELKDPSTYIGKSDRVLVKIKGTGLFGKAPENAAMIAARADGYYLVPIEEGYAKLNGNTVTQKELLKEGDLIELGGTTLQFTNPS
jgi:pSer/pThr/pTyr-binding forkhead associated (FHA) protein